MGVFDGTFLGGIEDILAQNEKKEIKIFSGEKLKEGDKVIGRLTRLEQAFFALSYAKLKEAEAICADCENIPEDQKRDKFNENEMLRKQAEALGRMGWTLIEVRLGLANVYLAIREDNEIVQLPEEEEEEGEERIASFIMRALGRKK